ncbi:MAG: hypothetical protein ACOCQ4_03365 [bacterium]
MKQKAMALNNIEAFVDIPWILLKENGEYEKFLFRRNNTLIVSQKGNVIKANWEYLDFDNSILIDLEKDSLLLNQGFILNGLMILKKEGTEELYPFVNQKIVPDLDISRHLSTIEKSNESNSNLPLIKTYNKGTKITIHQHSENINIGDVVYLNENETIPDGKYKVGFWLSIIVKNGKVYSVV